MMNKRKSTKTHHIIFIFGTRPEVVKIAPIIMEMRKHPDFAAYLCNTGQQHELSRQALEFFQLHSDADFDVMEPDQSLSELQSKILEQLTVLFHTRHFDGVIVQGDTMSAFCGALAGFYFKVPVFHVEAGLRSGSMEEPWPEEALRQMISRITALHFAPTERAYRELTAENIPVSRICLCGNTVIDAQLSLPENSLRQAEVSLRSRGLIPHSRRLLVTVHRRENHGERLLAILRALNILARHFPDHEFVFPVHLNPNVKEPVLRYCSGIPNIRLTEPLSYPELSYIMRNSVAILTDSGGIQEEASVFGKRVFVLREKTERREGVESGFSIIAGVDTDNLVTLVSSYLNEPGLFRISGQNPYGDGHASKKIVNALNYFFKQRKRT